MGVPLGLIVKGFAGVCCLGTAAVGSYAVMKRGDWTKLDEEVYAASGTGAGSTDPSTDTTITQESGKYKNLKISASTTSPSNKTWACVIKGTVPADAISPASKITEQFTTLKTGLGITGNGTITGQPSTNNKGKKFFDKCIESRTYSEGWEAWKGNKAESTVIMEVKKNGDSSNEYKFDETEFNKLYDSAESS